MNIVARIASRTAKSVTGIDVRYLYTISRGDGNCWPPYALRIKLWDYSVL